MYSFIDLSVDGLNYVRSVALKSAAFNPSWHLTAVGACRPLSRFTSLVGGGSAFFVRPKRATRFSEVYFAAKGFDSRFEMSKFAEVRKHLARAGFVRQPIWQLWILSVSFCLILLSYDDVLA